MALPEQSPPPISLPEFASRLNIPHKESIFKIAAYRAAIEAHEGSQKGVPFTATGIDRRKKEIAEELLLETIENLGKANDKPNEPKMHDIHPDIIKQYCAGRKAQQDMDQEDFQKVTWNMAQLEQKPFPVMKDFREQWNAIKQAGTDVPDPVPTVKFSDVDPGQQKKIDAFVQWQMEVDRLQGRQPISEDVLRAHHAQKLAIVGSTYPDMLIEVMKQEEPVSEHMRKGGDWSDFVTGKAQMGSQRSFLGRITSGISKRIGGWSRGGEKPE